MPPSIVITEPVARWKVWAQYSLKLGALVLLSALSFYLGTLYERLRQPAPQRPAALVPAEQQTRVTPAAAPATAAPKVPVTPVEAPAPQVWLATQALEGLQIQTLEVSKDPAQAGRLRYAFEVFNEGRLYEGSYEFLLEGTQQGQPTQWTFPVEGQAGQGVFRLRVARYLKTTGTLQLPAGFTPQALALRLKEPSGLRASRGLVLGEGAAAAALARPGS